MIIEDNDFLGIQHKKYIKDVILGQDFEWYFQNDTVDPNDSNIITNKKTYFCHTVLRRLEDRKIGETYNSPHAAFCIDVLNKFCIKNNIKYKEILRMAFNLTYNCGYEKCDIHQDHEYDHLQLLVYLNDISEKLQTVIKMNDKKIKIKPEIYKGVCFDNKPHYHYFTKQDRRVVMITTFR